MYIVMIRRCTNAALRAVLCGLLMVLPSSKLPGRFCSLVHAMPGSASWGALLFSGDPLSYIWCSSPFPGRRGRPRELDWRHQQGMICMMVEVSLAVAAYYPCATLCRTQGWDVVLLHLNVRTHGSTRTDTYDTWMQMFVFKEVL